MRDGRVGFDYRDDASHGSQREFGMSLLLAEENHNGASQI